MIIIAKFMDQRWKKGDHPIKKLNAVADPIPAKQDKIIPHWAKPKVWRRNPKAMKIPKNSSEKIIMFHASTVVIINKSLPNNPKPPAINPNCIAA